MEAWKQQPDSLIESPVSTRLDSLKTDTVARLNVSIKKPSIEEKSEIEAPVLPNFFYTDYTTPIAARSRIADADGWILPLILLLFFCIALINLAFPRSILQIVSACIRPDGIRKIQSDENAAMRKAMRLMHWIYIFLFPIFIYQVFTFGQIQVEWLSSFPMYWKLLVLSGGLLIGKISLVRIIGYLFNSSEESTTYRDGILVMNCLLVLALIPICLSLKITPAAYMPHLIAMGGACFTLFYLISIGIGAISGLRSNRLSKFHLILYFCALEAIPVFLILKIAKAFI